MSSHEYNITISIDIGKACPGVGELLEELESAVANYGYSQKLGVRSQCIEATLKSARLLTPLEVITIKRLMENTFKEQYPAWKARVESFRCKSGNVQQEAV